MNNSGITQQLLKLATVLTGRLYGGLAQVSIALSTLMSGVTGSSIADAAMNSRLLGGEMLKRGFSQRLRGRRAVVRLADGADHSAGHRLHPLRHGRPGVDRAPVRRRHHSRSHAVGGVGARDLDHGRAAAATSPSARRGRPRASSRSRSGAASGRSSSRSSCCSACASASSRRRRSVRSPWSTRSSIGVFAYRQAEARRLADAIEGSLADVGA